MAIRTSAARLRKPVNPDVCRFLRDLFPKDLGRQTGQLLAAVHALLVLWAGKAGNWGDPWSQPGGCTLTERFRSLCVWGYYVDLFGIWIRLAYKPTNTGIYRILQRLTWVDQPLTEIERYVWSKEVKLLTQSTCLLVAVSVLVAYFVRSTEESSSVADLRNSRSSLHSYLTSQLFVKFLATTICAYVLGYVLN